MKENGTESNITWLLYWVVILSAGYLVALATIDHVLYTRPIFAPVYYQINGLALLVVLGLILASRNTARLRATLLPLVIILLSIPPIVMAHLVTHRMPPIQASGPEAVMLRTMPLLLMALVLTAWQYGWRYVLLFSGCIAVFTLGMQLYFYRPGGASLLPPLTILLIQTISFLITGYFISMLLKRLQQEQIALAKANSQLTHYASTLEELTISRERNRMARELHDTLAHTLSALSVQLETVKTYWDVDSKAAQQMLDKSLGATRSGLQETRRALKSLRASPLEDMGLSLALRQMATETAERANLQLNLSMPTHFPSLPQTIEQCLYRITQEATANVAHHANARTLTVQHLSNVHSLLPVAGHFLASSCRFPHRSMPELKELRYWPTLAENAWPSLGENTWSVLGENTWPSIARKMT
ncbi:MAG: hypothetical protein JXR84_10890 [Anaerolineae bacterium]|nr:hypothetical protein [Anaerolineae bacterium]